MGKTISIETKRYSTLVRRILEAYKHDVVIKIDNTQFSESYIPQLLSSWCTNRSLESTNYFALMHKGDALFWFFDHPDNMCAAISVLPFIEKLAEEKIIRYEIIEQKGSRLRN
jgi:hypothetical protein